MSPARETNLRRDATRRRTKGILEQIGSGEIETYVGYRQLYQLWCTHNSAVEELRPMFRIAGVEPDGPLSITDEWKAQVVSISHEILRHFSK